MKESIENYLEKIYMLSGGKPVRSVDIANKMGVSRPSVFAALEQLKLGGYIEQELYGDVVLTAKGIDKAQAIFALHKAITRLLIEMLKIDPQTAEEDACKIEHDLSEQTKQKLLLYVENNLK